jgi:hypothetical protein
MRKSVFLLCFLSGYSFYVGAHAGKQEGLFAKTFILDDFHNNVGDILYIRGVDQFSRFVLQNSKPVVVRVFDGRQKRNSHSIYSNVAREMRSKVFFVSIDLSYPENLDVIQRLGLRSLVVPLFLFFNKRVLMLPPLYLLPIFEVLTKEKLDELKRDLKFYIEKQFFSKPKHSLLEKVGKLSKNLSHWLSGMKPVSRREVRAKGIF